MCHGTMAARHRTRSQNQKRMSRAKGLVIHLSTTEQAETTLGELSSTEDAGYAPWLVRETLFTPARPRRSGQPRAYRTPRRGAIAVQCDRCQAIGTTGGVPREDLRASLMTGIAKPAQRVFSSARIAPGWRSISSAGHQGHPPLGIILHAWRLARKRYWQHRSALWPGIIKRRFVFTHGPDRF